MRRREKSEKDTTNRKYELPDIPQIRPVKKVMEEINGMGIWNSNRMLTIIDSQILARKLELMGFGFMEISESKREILGEIEPSKLEEIKKDPKKLIQFSKAMELMQEIADLTDKGRDIKSTKAFIDSFGTS